MAQMRPIGVLVKRALSRAGILFVLALVGAFGIVWTNPGAAAALLGSDWPKAGHDLRNTASHGTPLTSSDEITLAWYFDSQQYDPNSVFVGSAAVDASTAYIGGYGELAPLYAVNLNGTLKWRTVLGDGSQQVGISGTPALTDDGGVIVASPYGLVRLRASDGVVQWSIPAIVTYEASPVIAPNGTIYVYGMDQQSGSAVLWAVQSSDGNVIWSANLGGAFYGTPAIGPDGTIYIATSDNVVRAFTTDGGELWTYELLGGLDFGPAIASDGTIYILTEGKLLALSTSGQLVWQYVSGGDYAGWGMAVVGDSICFGIGGSSQSVRCVTSGGVLRWQRDVDWQPEGGVVADPSTIYVAGISGVYSLSLAGGVATWNYQTPQGIATAPSLVPSQGLLLVPTTANGQLLAIGPVGGAGGSADTGGNTPNALRSKSPRVVIEKPKPGDPIAGDIEVIYAVSDPDGADTELGLGGAPIFVDYARVVGGLMGSWVSVVRDGMNMGRVVIGKEASEGAESVSVRIVARDRAGLITEAVVGPLPVDHEPPAFTVEAQTPKVSGYIDVSITSTEPLMGAPLVRIDQAGRGKVLAITQGEGKSFVARYEVVPSFDGIATVYVTGADLAGNEGSAILSGERFSVFVTPPTPVRITAPLDGTVLVDGDTVTVSGTSPSSTKVIVTVNGTERHEVTADAVSHAFSVHDIRLSAGQGGMNVITAIAETERGVSVPTVVHVVRNGVPRIALSRLPVRAGKPLADVVKLSWTADDPNGDVLTYDVSYSVDDGKRWVTLARGLTDTAYALDTTRIPDAPTVRLRVSANDGRTAAHAATGPVAVQNDLPVIVLTPPVADYLNTKTPTFRGEVKSTKYAVRTLEWSADRVSWTALPLAPAGADAWSFTHTLQKPLREGNATVSFRAKDERGKYGLRDAVFIVDTIAPRPPVLGVPATRIFNDTTDTDAALPGIQARLEGAAEPYAVLKVLLGTEQVGEGEVDRSGRFSLPVTLSAHGKRTYGVRATDAAGNVSDEATVDLTVNMRPRLVFTSPKTSNDYFGVRTRLAWSANDPDHDPVGDYLLAYRAAGTKAWTTLAEHLATREFQWADAAKLSSGPYELRLSGSDGFERVEVTGFALVDTVPPAITAALAVPARSRDPIVGGAGSAADDYAGIETVEFSLDGAPFAKATVVAGFRTATSTYRFSFPNPIADGTHTLMLRGTDRAENVSTSTAFTFTIDTTPPRIGSWRLAALALPLYPQDGAVRGFADTPYTFTIAASPDAETVALKVGAMPPVTLSRTPSGVFTGTVRADASGLQALRLNAVDDLGNAKEVGIGFFNAVPRATVRDASSGEQVVGAEVEVRLFDSATQAWVRWDGAAFGQENPLRTDSVGAFGISLPPGTYELIVRASGYAPTRTSPLELSRTTLLSVEVPLNRFNAWDAFKRFFN